MKHCLCMLLAILAMTGFSKPIYKYIESINGERTGKELVTSDKPVTTYQWKAINGGLEEVKHTGPKITEDQLKEVCTKLAVIKGFELYIVDVYLNVYSNKDYVIRATYTHSFSRSKSNDVILGKFK